MATIPHGDTKALQRERQQRLLRRQRHGLLACECGERWRVVIDKHGDAMRTRDALCPTCGLEGEPA